MNKLYVNIYIHVSIKIAGCRQLGTPRFGRVVCCGDQSNYSQYFWKAHGGQGDHDKRKIMHNTVLSLDFILTTGSYS